MRSLAKTLALLLLTTSCSLGLPEQRLCQSDSECVDAFGVGSVCSEPDGYCVGSSDDVDGVGTLVDGVSPTTIRTIGIVAQTGTAASIGIAFTAGLNAALTASTPEERGGYDLQHYALDDGYVPDNSVALVQEVTATGNERNDPRDGGADAIDGREAFAVLASVGSPTSAAMLETINTEQVPFIGTFSGAPHLYNSPPDRVVWQFRPEYEDESYELVNYLISVRDPDRVPVTNVFVLAQSPVMGSPCEGCEGESQGSAGQAAAAAAEDQTVLDAYGFAGYKGVRRALQEQGVSQVDIPLATYRANSIDMEVAVRYFTEWVTGIAEGAHAPVLDGEGKLHVGVTMVPVGLAGAEFIERVLDEVEQLELGQRPPSLTDEQWESVDDEWKTALESASLVFTSISPSGDGISATLQTGNAERLCGSYPIIVSQVVPFPLGNSSAAIEFRDELAAYDPSTQPGFAAFEGWAIGKIWAEMVRRTALTGEVTADSLIDVLETNFDAVDLGIGTLISYSQNDHLGSDQIFATRLDGACEHQDFSLDIGG